MPPTKRRTADAMTPAEKRVKELIDRWLTSIELHLQYTSLSDDAYWQLQNWPKHDRPTRWVLESAKQKANELKEVFEGRHSMGDSKFADALELMSFLANLVGAQHVDRFVPLAEALPETEMPKPAPRPVPAAPPTSDVPSWYAQAHAAQRTEPATRPLVIKSAASTIKAEASRRPANNPDVTREMPKPKAAPPAPPPAPAAKAKATPQKQAAHAASP
ncbi:MAG TPA: hypothetical protein VET48_09085, partial [Steroidobacteraceae bacterium]|nr:hypothetical protein [Steroidobacteraceae bacterium]